MAGVLHMSLAVPRARERSSRVLLLLGALLLLAYDASYGMGVTAQEPPMVLPGCREHCGNGVLIPYPFGIGWNCSRTDGLGVFGVRCVDNRPFLEVINPVFSDLARLFDPYEVIEISLETNEVWILTQVPPLCNGSSIIDSSSGNKSYSKSFQIPECCTLSATKNKLTTVGCNAFGALTSAPSSQFSRWIPGVGCLAACESETDRVLVDDSCSGFGCCQTSIPQGLISLSITYNMISNKTFPWLPPNTTTRSSCGYSFLTEASNYTFQKSHLSWSGNKTFPVVLDFAIVDDYTCAEAQNDTSTYACKSSNSDCNDNNSSRVFSTPYASFTCTCSQGYRGNPYLQDGCQDIDECLEPDKYDCNGNCVNTPGSYKCHPSKPVTFIGDVALTSFTFSGV